MENLTAIGDFARDLGPVATWLFALLIIIVGYFVAKLIRTLVVKGLGKTSFDDKIAKLMGQPADGAEKGIGMFVFYLFMLFVVIFALSVAGEETVVEPLKNILSSILGFIPKLLAASIIGFVTWVIATLAKNIVSGFLGAARVDDRLGLGEKKPITSTLSLVVFFGIILIMLPNILAALELDEISQPIASTVDTIFEAVPPILFGLIILGLGYLIASIVQKVLSNVLEAVGIDKLAAGIGFNGIGGRPLSIVVSYIAMATILVIFIAQAIDAMKLDFISSLAENFVPGYFAILSGVIIFIIAIYVAELVAKTLAPKSSFWAKFAKVAILVFAGAVALQRANISSLTNETFQTIINAAIIAAAFAAGVGGAIALGLGGREKAKALLEKVK